MHYFYQKISSSSCSHKRAEFCDVALLFSAEMQMIVHEFNARGDRKRRNKKQPSQQTTPQKRARTIAPISEGKIERHTTCWQQEPFR